MKRAIIIALLTLAIGAPYASAESANPETYHHKWVKTGKGGGVSTVAGLKNHAIITQAMTGIASDGKYTLKAGFAQVSDPFAKPSSGEGQLPSEFALSQIYPNPFNAQSIINYALPSAGRVELTVFNLLGQKVAILTDGYQEAGYHSITWDASHNSSGIYFYKLSAGGHQFVKRMMLIK